MSKKDVLEIAWADEPPPKKKVRAPIRRPKAAQKLRFVVCDEVVTQVWTHWIQGRTQPCLGAGCECANWRPGENRRWKGYLMAHEVNGAPLVIVELTPEAYQGSPELRDKTTSLRGALLDVQRLGIQANGKVRATVQLLYRKDWKESPIPCKEALWEVWFAEGESRLTQAKIAGLKVSYQEQEISPATVAGEQEEGAAGASGQEG